MEIRGRILVTIVFVEVRVELLWSKARSGIPEIVGAWNFLGVVSLRQIRTTYYLCPCCALPHTEVVLQSEVVFLIGAFKGVQKVCTETVKYLPIGACDNRIVDVGT